MGPPRRFCLVSGRIITNLTGLYGEMGIYALLKFKQICNPGCT